MSLAMVGELRQALAQAESTAGSAQAIRVVVLRGAGGHFCAGGDLKDMAAARMRAVQNQGDAADPIAHVNAEFGHLCAAFAQHPVGRGGGSGGHGDGRRLWAGLCGRCGNCHRDRPFSTARNVARRGARADCTFSRRTVGYSQAKRLAVTGGRLDATEALAVGLVHQQVATGEVDAAVQAVLADILACAPGALAATKALMAKARWGTPAIWWTKPPPSSRAPCRAPRARKVRAHFCRNANQTGFRHEFFKNTDCKPG